MRKLIREIIYEEIDSLKFRIALVEIDQVAQAKDFARDVHKGQWRKSSPLPYMVHPMRVYHRTKTRGLSKKHQILAILHDTYEDSKNPQRTLKKIKDMFGPGTAKLVTILSHDKGIDYKEYLLNLAKKSPTAFTIKLLDMEDNLADKPHLKQKNKYKEALEYLVEKGIKIEPKIKDKLFKLVGVQQ